jgi:hypothetical protein
MRRRTLLLAVVILALMVGALVVGFFGRLSGPMESSWAYEQGLQLVRSSPQAVEVLGHPIEAGKVDGWVRISGETGDAELSVPVSGPRGSGVLELVARKRSERWSFERATLDVFARDRRLDLMSGAAKPPLEAPKTP